MTRKDYEKAADIVRNFSIAAKAAGISFGSAWLQATAIEDAFVKLFTGDNDLFDERHFRDACKVQT